MKSKIKKVIRKNFAETNSSSSHSLVIDMSSTRTETDSLNISDSGKEIIVARGRSYGRENGRTNKSRDKLDYVVAVIESHYEDMPKMKQKLKIKLESAVLNFTGAERIIYKEQKEPSVSNRVDVTDILKIYEIFETKETLKQFLFSPDSYLYLGDDEYSPTGKYSSYYVGSSQEVEAILSIEFGGKIGRVDFEIYDLNYAFEDNELYRILSGLCIDLKVGKDFIPYENKMVHGDESVLYSSYYLSRGLRNCQSLPELNNCFIFTDYKTENAIQNVLSSTADENLWRGKVLEIINSNPDHFVKVPFTITIKEFDE